MSRSTLTTADLAAGLDVDPSTIRKRVQFGLIKPDFLTPGGHARFYEATLRRLQKDARAKARAPR